MNKREDLLISGSIDNTIKFWNKIDTKWSIQQTVAVNYQVYDISLNEEENKLISRVFFKSILILEKGSDEIWKIVQTIDSDGRRLCFTVGNQFVFQPLYSDKLEVYDYNQVMKQFEKIQEVKVERSKNDVSLFPCQYIQKVNIVAVKYGIYLNIFKIDSIGKYYLIKTIEFGDYNINGRLSDDGEYLVTWDYFSKQIQVRNLKYIE